MLIEHRDVDEDVVIKIDTHTKKKTNYYNKIYTDLTDASCIKYRMSSVVVAVIFVVIQSSQCNMNVYVCTLLSRVTKRNNFKTFR